MSTFFPSPAAGAEGDEPIPYSLTPRAVEAYTVHLEAEIEHDADTGALVLVVGDGWNCDAATPEQLRARITAARASLDQLGALADDFEARVGGAGGVR